MSDRYNGALSRLMFLIVLIAIASLALCVSTDMHRLERQICNDMHGEYHSLSNICIHYLDEYGNDIKRK